MFPLINPITRTAPFDHPESIFEVKFDGFRVAATPPHLLI
jgi:ATP-dependent DNA ligase